MDKQGKQTKIGTPLFDELTYAFWSIRMKVYLQAQGTDVWKMIVNTYNIPVGPSPTSATERKYFEDNLKAMNAILSGLTEMVFVKVMHCETENKYGISLETSMKEMTKSREQKFRPIEHSLRI